ncbi:MAG: calcium/sodium antiporter [Alphaproteobacteria bacterium]|jgi:cation:H+ antiporter
MPGLEQILASDYTLILAGLFLLALGAESLVHGAVSLALRLRVSPLLVGITIVAWGTSTPELIVSVNASMSGNYGIAVGNVVGSNIVNVLLILGVAALISPISIPPRAIGRDGLFALAAAGLFIWLALKQPILGFNEGVLFLGVLAAMAVFAYGQESGKTEEGEGPALPELKHPVLMDLMLIVTGLGLLVIGADVLVHGSVSVARGFGISETVIGLTLVAAGTSLPELATSVAAALRGRAGISVGNVTGSNVYNVLGILGVAALIAPVQIDPTIVQIDMWVMLAATLLLFPPLLFGNRIGRLYGVVLLAGYGAYLAYLFTAHG